MSEDESDEQGPVHFRQEDFEADDSENARRFDGQVGSNIRALRKARTLSQAGLAQAMQERGHDWHQTTVSRVETGKQPLQMEEAEDLEELLGGNLIAGTAVQKSMQASAARMRWGWMERRVTRAETALAAAAEQLSELRQFIDHSREHGGDDGEH